MGPLDATSAAHPTPHGAELAPACTSAPGTALAFPESWCGCRGDGGPDVPAPPLPQPKRKCSQEKHLRPQFFQPVQKKMSPSAPQSVCNQPPAPGRLSTGLRSICLANPGMQNPTDWVEDSPELGWGTWEGSCQVSRGGWGRYGKEDHVRAHASTQAPFRSFCLEESACTFERPEQNQVSGVPGPLPALIL